MNIREHLGHIIQHAQAAERRGDDIEARLARIKTFVTSPDRLTEWDGWRKYIADGGGGSWPRDAYECILDWVAEECDEAGAMPHVTAERIAAVLTDGNPLHLPFSEQWRIPEVAEKIAGLFAAGVKSKPLPFDTRAVISRAEETVKQAYAYLRQLFVTCAPQCKPLPDLLGLCTQIDSLIAGLRTPPPSARSQAGAFVPSEAQIKEMTVRLLSAKCGKEADVAFAYAQECGAIGAAFMPLTTEEEDTLGYRLLRLVKTWSSISDVEWRSLARCAAAFFATRAPSPAEPPAATVGEIAEVLVRRTNPNWREWALETAREIAALTTRARPRT